MCAEPRVVGELTFGVKKNAKLFFLLLLEGGVEICIKHAAARSPHPCAHSC